MTFREECEEWLGPLGYSIHFSNRTETSLTFSNFDNIGFPSIECSIENQEKSCRLTTTGLKLFMTIETGRIQFKHLDIQRYIDSLRHYYNICIINPPF